MDDLYANKIGFIIALNFPQLTLKEKEALGDDRKAWAYARLGDMFTERIPAEVKQAAADTESDADIYIADYNIYMGHLLTPKEKPFSPPTCAYFAIGTFATRSRPIITKEKRDWKNNGWYMRS